MFGILRTILAINVILLHIFNVYRLGNFSVSFFFILSGFLMTYILNKTYGYNLNGFKVFWINRILRLYPIYLVVLITTLAVILLIPGVARHPSIFSPSSIQQWLSNLTMIFPNIVPHRVEPRLVPPSWALTNELFFYFLISIGISRTYKRTIIWVVLSILYYLFTYKFYDLATFRYSAIPAASLPFSLGALLFWSVNKYKSKLKENYLLIILYLGLFYINGIWGRNLGDLSIYLNMIIGVFLIYELFKFKNKKFFKIDKYIGLYSYPIYLSHFFISIIYLYFFNPKSTTFKLNLNEIFVYSIFLLSFNFLLVHLIDIKIDRIKKRIKKKSKLKV